MNYHNAGKVQAGIGTFFEACPNGMIFANTFNGAGYDLVLLGQVEHRASTSTRSRRG